MKLFISGTSPFSRKARIVLLEKGLRDAVHIETVAPFDDPPELLRHTAVGKVPVLVTDEGALSDSRVICEYLDALGDGPRLLPDPPWQDRRRASEADAIMDSALLVVLESRREAPQRSASWIARQTERIERILSHTQLALGPLRLAPLTLAPLTLGDVSLACALHYLDFRLPQIDWRGANSALAEWHDGVESLASFSATRLG